MSTTKFIIRSDGESLAHWLQANWHAPAGNPATASDGQAWLQPPTWNRDQRQIMAGAWVTGEAAAHGPTIPEVIRFDLLPLGDGRLEVVATCEPLFDAFLDDLLVGMGKRWPEVLSTLGKRDLPTLRRAPDGNVQPEPGPKPEPGQPEPANDDWLSNPPFSTWDPKKVLRILDLSKQPTIKVTAIVTDKDVLMGERTVVRIRAALAEVGRLKRRND